jgi:hypothetical protein
MVPTFQAGAQLSNALLQMNSDLRHHRHMFGLTSVFAGEFVLVLVIGAFIVPFIYLRRHWRASDYARMVETRKELTQ